MIVNPSAKPRGKPPATSFFCEQSHGMEKARGNPKGIPRDGPLVRSRGDPGG